MLLTLYQQAYNMFNWITTIFTEIKEFVNLESNKQVLYVFLLLLVIFGSLVVFFYKKAEKLELKYMTKLQEIEKTIYIRDKQIDSLKTFIFDLKVQYLNKELNRSDSILQKELAKNEKALSAINPIIKKTKSKLNEINN